MKILILGSEGFIGSHLVNFYLKKKWEVVACDLIEKSNTGYEYHKISLLSNDIDLLFKSSRGFNFCINASGSGNVSLSIKQPNSDFDANLVSVSRILNALKSFSSECKYLHISSAAIYGNPLELPINENAIPKPLSPYGWHKLMSELLCKEYFDIYGLGTAIIRPFSVYGPGLKKQLFWDTYKKIINSEKNQIEAWGTGRESRDFIYIDDLLASIDVILRKSNFCADIYNIASGTETTITEALHLLIHHLNEKITIKFNNVERMGDPKNWKADITKIKELGFKPNIDINSGIKMLAEWLIAQ